MSLLHHLIVYSIILLFTRIHLIVYSHPFYLYILELEFKMNILIFA
jgi:hypothetical protein